jgi:hypothetical protein
MLLEPLSKLVLVHRDLHWISSGTSIKSWQVVGKRPYITVGSSINTRTSRLNHFVLLLLSFGVCADLNVGFNFGDREAG